MRISGPLIGLSGLALIGCSGDKAPPGDDTGPVDDKPVVLGACEEPEDIGENPLSLVSTLVIRDEPDTNFGQVHLVDIEYDESREVAYAAGTGGFFVVEESGGAVNLLGYLKGNGGGGGGTLHKMTVLTGTNMVAVTNRDRGLQVLRVDDPTQITRGYREEASDMSGLGYQDGLLYVLKHTGSVLVYDMSTPDAPTVVTEVDGLGNPWDLEIVGDLAYVADNSLGIVVLDLSTPEAPTVLTEVAAQGGVQDLWVQGDFLYAAVGSVGIETFDLGTPSAPASLGVTDIGRSAVAVSAANDQLWAATQEGVVALDISTPSAPTPLASAKTEEWAMHVVADGDRAWVADWSLVSLLELDPSLQAPVADVTPDFLYLYEGETSTSLTITNRGGAALTFTGLGVDDERVTASIDRAELEPGESATVLLDFDDDGETVDATLCFSSNDPSAPVREVEVSSSSSMTSVAIGQPAYDFVLSDIDGNSHQLSDQLGKPVVLTYFATW